MTNQDRAITVPLDDLCTIADAIATMKHDLDNGKRKHLDIEIERIHAIVEGWAQDENMLGGADCHDDHRCRLCRDSPGLSGLRDARRRLETAGSSDRGDSQPPGMAEEEYGPNDDPTTPEDIASVPDPAGQSYITQRGEEFILEAISDSVVKVTHREQIGYFGVNRNWDPLAPYTLTQNKASVHADGIDGSSIISYARPGGALKTLCGWMLESQRKLDAGRDSPEDRKNLARWALGEFLEGPEISD